MKSWLLIAAICLVSGALRFWQLHTLPTILNRDEAALAYNAKLLRETGKDEWGASWPLALESFGDYKLPGYVWSLIPLFSVFGYHDWVVRLPSALAGLALIPLTYLFARALGWDTRRSHLVAALVATTPIFFFYSRIGFEANLALSLLVGSLTLLFTKASRPRRLWFDVAAIGLCLMAIFTYNTPLLLLPFIMVTVPLMREFKKIKTWIIPVVGLSLVLVFGGIQLLSLSKQKSGITIFQDESTWQQSVDYYQKLHGVQRVLFGNRIVFFGSKIMQNYAVSLSPLFLIAGKGGHPWHSLANFGHLLAITYALGLVGILFAVIKPTKQKSVLLFLLVTSLLPAVVTVDAPHATRSLLFFFLLTVLAASGLHDLAKTFFAKNRVTAAYLLIAVIAGLSFVQYVHGYFTSYATQFVPANLRPGFAEAVQDLSHSSGDDQVAIVDDEGFHYILLAWYLQVEPPVFFETVVRQQPDRIGFRYGEQVDRYHFIAAEKDRKESERKVMMWDRFANRWQIKEF